jgi:hypothetical protein
VKHDDIKRAGIQRGSELFGIATRALERTVVPRSLITL